MTNVRLVFEFVDGDKTLVCTRYASVDFTPFLGMPYMDKELIGAFGIWEKSQVFFVSSVVWVTRDDIDSLEVELDLPEENEVELLGNDFDAAKERIDDLLFWEVGVES